MYKFIALIPRRHDVSREFFQNYYETQHTPLALGYFRGFSKYLRNHVVEELSGSAPDFDVFSGFWYESMGELAKSGAFLESELAPIIRDDERQFMDQSRIRALSTEEHLMFGNDRCFEAEAVKLVFAVKLADSALAGDFLSSLKSHSNELVANWDASRISCFMVQAGAEPNQWDAIVFAWLNVQESQSYEVPIALMSLVEDHMLLKTRSIETDLEDVYQNVPAKKGATNELSV
ncbi:MAG: EthD domain-containing protein [Pseudomonadales bacterium]